MSKRRYSLTIVYDPETEDLEWLCETVEAEAKTVIPESKELLDELPEAEIKEIGGHTYCVINLADYFDEETLKMIDGSYIIAEA